jgi:pimeloyl-ACP methyl ester carboxylesterase
MLGGKALALEAWASAQGRAMLRLDYAGCGESEGDFEAQTLEDWRDDALAVVAAYAPEGPLLLVGSSMGGWLALLLAESLGSRVAGLIGIAAAPDFTDWGFSETDKLNMNENGRIEQPSAYDDSIMVTSFCFWQSGQSLRLLDRAISIDCPVRLLQGQQDDAVPWEIALRIAGQIRSADVQVTLIKDGVHRLSRPQDIALLIGAVADLIDRT